MIEGFQNTDIGLIPNDWEFGRIDEYFTIQQGKSVSKANRIGDNQKPFLRTSNLLWGKVILEELDYLHFSKEEEIKFKLQFNDLLVCEGGDIGRTAIWKNEMEDVYYQNHLHRLRSKVMNIDPTFVLYWMQYAIQYAKIYFGRANITTIPNLSKSRLAEFLIPVPPLPEQRKIAYILSTVQKAIEQQDKLIRTTTELKKALMQKLFTEGLNYDLNDEMNTMIDKDKKNHSPSNNQQNHSARRLKQTEIGLVPESWEVKTFAELFEIIKSQSHSRNKLTYEATNSQVYNIHYGDIHSTFKKPVLDLNRERLPLIKDEYNCDTRNEYLKDGDIVIADASEDLIDIGKCVELKNVGNKKVVGGLHTIVARPLKDLIHKGYGAYIFKNKYVAEELRFIATGMSVYGISKGNLLKLKIPVPPVQEQKEIALVMERVDSKLEFHQKKKQTLSALFKTLLHELMTGQRRVHSLNFDLND